MISMEQGAWRYERPISKRIAILVYENCSFVDIGLILEAFDLANSVAAKARSEDPHYSVSILSREGGLVRCTGSVSIETRAFNGLATSAYDALFIAGGKGASIAAKDSQTAGWLERVLQKVPVVQAAGNGALLLKGVKRASARGMTILVRPANRELDSTPVKRPGTSVNVGAPLIAALSLIKDDFNYQTAENIAERLMPFSGGWLEPLLGDPLNANVASTIREAARWIDEHCAQPITVEDMARSASMSERTFLRHFKAETGMPPSGYLLRTRLDMACRLLITTTLPIDKVARRCGMCSGVRLAKIFKRSMGISASDYRSGASAALVVLEHPKSSPGTVEQVGKQKSNPCFFKPAPLTPLRAPPQAEPSPFNSIACQY